MKVYIRSVSSVNPIGSYDAVQAVNNFSAGVRLKAVEPDYKLLIADSGLRRRMSRFIKMGVAAGLQCMQQSGTVQPDGIITATGLGCIEDTRKFLQAITDGNEQLLSPTAFIQSTFNTVGAQLALLLNCHEYNTTYVHRGFSFESALIDGMLMLSEGAGTILVGAVDEQTNDTFAILNRLGEWKKEEYHPDLYTSQTKGTIAGEGAQFVLLSSAPSPDDYAELQSVHTFHADSGSDIADCVQVFLKQQALATHDITTIMLGENGDKRHSRLYANLKNDFKGSAIQYFKHLCGEYPTASSFAFWLAANNLKEKGEGKLLIVNHYGLNACTLMLLSR